MSRTTRRAVLTAIAATPLVAIPAIASAPKTAVEQVKHHVAEISRILAETTPEGFKSADHFFVINGNLQFHAFPPNWEIDQPYALLETRKGGWRIKTRPKGVKR